MTQEKYRDPALRKWRLSSPFASVSVWSFAAAIHNLAFWDANGDRFEPLAEASWLEDEHLRRPVHGAPHLQFLGGEWPCVPFGSVAVDGQHHGYCANHHWRLDRLEASCAELSIAYPQSHVIKSLHRSIRLAADRPMIILSLTVHAREDWLIPIGLHPIFKMPQENGNLGIEIPAHIGAISAPSGLAPSTSNLPSGRAVSLDQVSLHEQEVLVQIWQTEGNVLLRYPKEKQSVQLSWEADKLPHCLLWSANPTDFGDSRLAPFTGLGVEPVDSFFDNNDHNKAGFEGCFGTQNTGVKLTAGKSWSIEYQIALADFDASN